MDFGKTQNGYIVNEVKLPKWAKTPEEFIYKHRMALESDYISQNINNWIDLIFGYKQRGEEAKNSINVFYYLTYEGNVDLKTIQDIKLQEATYEQIFHYGQTPSQIFYKPHPQRQNLGVRFKQIPIIDDNFSIIHYFSIPVVFLSKASKGLNVILKNRRSYFISNKNLFLKNYKILETTKNFLNGKTNFTEYQIKSQIQVLLQLKESSIFAVGGYSDDSAKIIKDFKISDTINFHNKIVTCVSYCEKRRLLICGSEDFRISAWKLEKNTLCLKKKNPRYLIYGHHNKIHNIVVNVILGLILSADIDGTCIIHLLRNGRFINCFLPKLIKNEIIINLRLHDDAEILILTSLNKIMIYDVNGQLLRNFNWVSENISKIIYLNYFFNDQKKLILATSKGNINIINAYTFENTDESIKLKQILKKSIEMKKVLPNDPILDLEMDLENQVIICGYLSGNLSMLYIS